MEPLLVRPRGAKALLVLAHGAGAGMRHPFMATLADALAERAVATLRWEFPYMAAGRARPDRPDVAEAAVHDAWAAARALKLRVPMFAGGKSFGGRMTSNAAAHAPIAMPGLRGIALVGFPLHAPDKPGTERAAHLREVAVPMLFVQGTRDALAPLPRLRPVVRALGDRARLAIIDGADHGFAVARRADADVIAEIAGAISAWMIST